MKNFVVAVLIAASALTMVVTDVQAKRMGSGSSAGKQSQFVNKQSAAPAQNQNAPAASTPAAAGSSALPAKPASPWKGMLGGALLGLGLGALLSQLGIGGALASMIGTILMVALLAGAAFFIYRMLARKREGPAIAKTGLQPAYGGAAPSAPQIGSRIEESLAKPLERQSSSFATASGNTPDSSWNVPADFDSAAFLRSAKTYFIRLQAAWDKADVNDLRAFTSPELFAEMKQQLLDRGESPNHTDVVFLDAELLGVETTDNEYLASVKFSGRIKDAEDAPAEAFTEVWNLSKPIAGQGGWLLAGIQQVS
jgi:predicted lipid-binding transport protein (Tim44 family)